MTQVLEINHLYAILGMSMGGMNAWQWAEAWPDMMDGVIPVVSLPVKVSGRNLLWRRMVIDAIRQDPSWQGGNYTGASEGWLHGYGVLCPMIGIFSVADSDISFSFALMPIALSGPAWANGGAVAPEGSIFACIVGMGLLSSMVYDRRA